MPEVLEVIQCSLMEHRDSKLLCMVTKHSLKGGSGSSHNKIVFKGRDNILCLGWAWYQLKTMQRTWPQCLHNLLRSFKCYSMYVSNNLWCHFQQCPSLGDWFSV